MTINEACRQTGISPDTLRYYERVGVIPKVKRTSGGIRDFGQDDINWINNAICMRNAGMSVEALAEYVSLYQMGDETLQKRLDLLSHEREGLLKQKEKMEETLRVLDHKISRYEAAVVTGILSWE